MSSTRVVEHKMRQLAKNSGAQLFVLGLDNLAGCRFLFYKEIHKNMDWVISILSAILIGALYGGIAGNAMLPRNKNNKIIQNRMIRYTIVCIVLLSCNFLFSFWHGVVAIVLGYFIQIITGSQIKEQPEPDFTELIKVRKEIAEGDMTRTLGWKPVVASIAHINSIPHHVIDTVEVMFWSRKYNFPKQVKGYTGVLWIARENTAYMPDHMLVFSPVFNNTTDAKLWNKVPLTLCSDIESWLEIKEASEKTLIIDDDIKMTPLTNDKDFSILTALLKTKHYKDIK